MKNDDFTIIVSRGGRCHWVSICPMWLSHSKWQQVEQRICIEFFIKLEYSFVETIWVISEGCSYGQMVIGSFINGDYTLPHASRLVQRFLLKHQITQVTQPHYSPNLAPCDFWLFSKLKSLLKMKRFQTIDDIQKNMMGQLMVTGRTVWDPKVLTCKGTGASLSYVQCFLYLAFSSINCYIFHITWLDTFWTDLVYFYITRSLHY